jgi:hypothetical protein
LFVDLLVDVCFLLFAFNVGVWISLPMKRLSFFSFSYLFSARYSAKVVGGKF